MKNVQVLLVSDEGNEVVDWKSSLNQLGLQINHRYSREVLTSPRAASGHELVIIDSDHHQNAITLCSLIRMRYCGIILLYVNSDHESQVVEGYDAGADDYIVKPRSSRILQAKVAMWCARIEQVRTTTCP